eukprot:2887549-Amphidinium_carterae.1
MEGGSCKPTATVVFQGCATDLEQVHSGGICDKVCMAGILVRHEAPPKRCSQCQWPVGGTSKDL